MFVDDLLSAIPRHLKRTRLLIASCIESVYALLGYPGPITNPFLTPTMAWDKMGERPVGPYRVSLGTDFINTRLSIGQQDHKVERLKELIESSWNKGIKRFLPIAAAKLIGNVINAAQHANWLRWSLHHIIHEMKTLLRKIHYRLARSKHFQSLLGEKDEGWLDPNTKKFAKRIFHNRSITSLVWRQKVHAFITNNIREEIQYLLEQCKEHLNGTKRWERQLSHIVKRVLDGRIRQDACTSWGMGGYSADLGFWWQIKWSDLSDEVSQLIIDGKISINVLELAAVVTNFFATALHFKQNPTKGGWHPKVYCQGDNSSSVGWYNKFSNLKPHA